MSESSAMSSEPRQRLVIVTGPSGAGRSTAIHVLEDLGFEAIDNLPMSLLRRLLDGAGARRPLAVGIDVRNRDFSVEALQEMLDWVDTQPWLEPQLLFLDCSEDVLVQRFSETRRRHPLTPGEAAIVGIREEQHLLQPIRARADVLIDTSDASPHDLKARLAEWFGPEGTQIMGLTLRSFSYKRGLPKDLDMVFDCRFLKNPHWEPSLRLLTGKDAPVQEFIAADPLYMPFHDKLVALLTDLLPAFKREGKAHLSIGFGCTGGQHRSVAVTETIAKALAADGWQVSKRHREQDRWGAALLKQDENS